MAGNENNRTNLIDEILDKLGVKETPFFKTPDYMYNPSYWLGAMVTAALVWQAITGLTLLLYYEPANAYPSTQNIIHNVPFGPVILFSHLYGAYIMIVLVYIHMFRNFYKGAYKKPRELQWVTGTILLALTLGVAFFGYSLVSDVLGVNAVDIGNELLVGTGFPGASTIATWLFGPGGSAALSSNPLTRSLLFDRLLGWHLIFVSLIFLLFGVHFIMAERYGMTPSAKEKPKVPAYYTKEEQQKFNEWWPRNFVYMLSLVLITWGIILFVPDLLANINGLPIVINPYPAPQAGTPAAEAVQPYPPWFFLFLYKFVDFELPNGQPLTPAMVISVLIIILLVIMFLPFYDNSQFLYLRSRKFWAWLMTLGWIYIIILSVWGYLQPGVPAPFSEQLMYLGPPAVIVGLIIYFWDKITAGRKKELVSVAKPPRVSITPNTILLTSVALIALAGTFGNFLLNPTIVNMIALVPVGMFAAYMVYKMAKGFLHYTPGSLNATTVTQTKKRVAYYGMIAILILSAILVAIFWTLPMVGPKATYAGMDLGVIFMLWGYALQLYHYIVYVK